MLSKADTFIVPAPSTSSHVPMHHGTAQFGACIGIKSPRSAVQKAIIILLKS